MFLSSPKRLSEAMSSSTSISLEESLSTYEKAYFDWLVGLSDERRGKDEYN
jgi:hypothetical protein